MPRKRWASSQQQPAPPRQRLPLVAPPVLTWMTPLEALTYLEEVRDRLKHKQARERAYLDRRAARGTYTPTDEAYEADQQLEVELIALVDHLISLARSGGLISEDNKKPARVSRSQHAGEPSQDSQSLRLPPHKEYST